MTLRSLTLMPKSIFPAHPPAGYQVDTLCCNGEVDDGYLKGDDVEKKDLDELESELQEHQPLSASLTNPLYISVCTFFCCQTLRCYYFLARSHDWLHNMLHEHDREEESAYWGQVFGYFLMAAIFVAPFSGVVIDKSMAYFASKSNVNAAHGTLTVHCGLTALFGVFYSLTAYSNIPELQYVTFFLFVFHRSFTFAGAAAYVGMLFPSPLFHNLFGLLNFSSLWTGFGTQLFEGLFGWSIDQANLFLAALLCSSLAHPVLTFMKGRSKL